MSGTVSFLVGVAIVAPIATALWVFVSRYNR